MVPVVPVFGTILDQVVPALVDLSIWYPVIAEPPLLDGAVQERLICVDDAAVAVRPVGGCDIVKVVALASFDWEDSPTELTAVTL